MSTKTYHGSCHCGAVRYEADLDLEAGTYRCNCSSCMKNRSWFAPAPPEAVRIVSGAEMLRDYRWIPPGRDAANLTFRFCRTCGARTVGDGGHGFDGKPFRFVSIATLDDADADVLAASLRYFDGKHDRYDQIPEDIRLL